MTKKTKFERNTSMSQTGKGDSYGSGYRNPVGRVKSSYLVDGNTVPKIKTKKPPKQLA